MEAPPVIPTARPPRTFWWLLATLPLLAAGIVLFQFNPAQNGFFPRCALYTTTGLYCPGCGSLRALHQLAHGHLLTALHYNPLLVLSLPFVLVYTWRCAWSWTTGGPLPAFAPSGLRLKWLVAVVILFTVLRNIPYEPFTWLAPPGGN